MGPLRTISELIPKRERPKFMLLVLKMPLDSCQIVRPGSHTANPSAITEKDFPSKREGLFPRESMGTK